VIKDKVLQATANYNLADDKESCVDGEACVMYPKLKLPVLSVRICDNIRFMHMTGFENIAFGELISPIDDPSREAEMARANLIGCFTTLRCTFAHGNEPDVPDETPIDLLPAKRERDKSDAAGVKSLTRGQIAAIRECNESRIKDMIYDEFHYTDLEQAIAPETGEMAKRNIRTAIANSFGAVYSGKRPKVTLKPNAPTKTRSASDEVASGARDVAEAMDELRDALFSGMPNRRIKNLRQVQPKIGQTIQITSPGHVLYELPPGSVDPKKVINPVIAHEASLGKQHKVLELCDGTIGQAHYYAAKIQIQHEGRPMEVYLTYRVRFFEHQKGKKCWTSRYDMHWWCKTMVGDDYFDVNEEEAGRRSKWENDRQYGRVIADTMRKSGTQRYQRQPCTNSATQHRGTSSMELRWVLDPSWNI